MDEMNRRLFYSIAIVSFLVVAIFGCATESKKSHAKSEYKTGLTKLTTPFTYVNPFIGTGGHGFGVGSGFPGPKVPFGMVAPSPDTTFYGIQFPFYHCSGYYYGDAQIRGFSQTHLYGTGAGDYGVLLFMPTVGFNESMVNEAGYRSSFSHHHERAEPGYYSVLLIDPDIFVELTATDYVAVHRYTYPDGSTPYVIINPSHSLYQDWVKDAEVNIDKDKGEVSGFCDLHGDLSGRGNGVKVYFAAQFSSGFSDFGIWENGSIRPLGANVSGADVGAYVGFAPQKGPLVVKVGISYQSEKQARANLKAQVPDFDFDKVRKGARERWDKVLSKIEVKGGTEEQKKIFYSALYHVYMMPDLFTEGNGKYLGFDLNLHDAGEHTYYTDFSLWDTFRTLHPLLFLLDPKISADMMQSLTRMYVEGGSMPRWPLAEGYTCCMVGTSADVVLAEAYLKGIRNFDYATAYQGCYEHATGPVQDCGRGGLDEYINLGYICEEHQGQGVSLTLEYCYDDAALALWAKEMGIEDDFNMFSTRSHNYQNYWDPELEFLRPKNCEGAFVEPFNPNDVFSEYYVEGDAWHWLWYVPHDAPGLIDLFGSDDAFVGKLNFFFEQASVLPDSILPDRYYWHGNEPDIFSAYLFNWTNQAALTQKWARWIMGAKYKNAPDGIDGNDDCGTLSAWYVFSSLGFFPVAGTDIYVIGSPIFDEAVIHLDGGDLVITVENNSPENVYVKKVYLNGKELKSPYFRHADIVAGGELKFIMSATPKTDWQKVPSVWEIME